MVDHGMDIQRSRGIASQLREQGSALATLSAHGTAMMHVLEEVWSGQDGHQFAQDWGAAKPSLDAASQSVTTLGNVLDRQADQQEHASVGSGAVPSLDALGLSGASLVGASSTVPKAAGMFDSIGDFFEDLWEWVQSPWVSWPTWVNDVVAWTDDAYKWLDRFPLVRTGVRILGKIALPLGIFMSAKDIAEALESIYKDGWSLDAGLQLTQGVFGAISLALGVAAAAATGTIVGIPAGVLLGGFALLFGAASIGIGYIREDPEGFYRDARDAGLGKPFVLPGMPGSQSPTPDISPPSLPKPPMPPMPSLPNRPVVPNPPMPVPPMPRLPDLPDPPAIPNPWVPVPTWGG